jgi:predicted component of type VI protein secretion system
MAAVTNRERVHTYLLLKGAGPAERVIVWDTQDVSVGRSPENDLSIDDAALSRRHAEFYRADGGYAIKDLGTSNGTTVNGETVHTRVLQNKDVVRLGEVEITFVQIAKNPAAVGKRVEFASQLKNFGGAAGQAKDGESTMLGLVQTLDTESDEEDFVVGKINDFGDDLAPAKAPARRQAPRDLDAELGGLGDDLMGAPVAAAPPIPVPARPPVAKPAPRLAPPPSPEWALDDVPEAPAVAKPPARPAARVAAPAAPAAAPAPAAAKPARRSVSLQLEIDGLSGDLRQLVESLLGKVIELPPLRIRVKADDLD